MSVGHRFFVGLDCDCPSGLDPLYYPAEESLADFRALQDYARQNRVDIYLDPVAGAVGAFRLTLINTHKPFINKDGEYEGTRRQWPVKAGVYDPRGT